MEGTVRLRQLVSWKSYSRDTMTGINSFSLKPAW